MSATAGRWLLCILRCWAPRCSGPSPRSCRRGREVPDLRATVDPASGWPERWTAAATGGGPAEGIVGFSGAGPVLPAVAVAAGARRVVWIDVLVPAREGATEMGEEIKALIGPLIGDDGRIVDWTTWWGAEVFAELVPDARLRGAILAEGHRLPADFYDVAVPAPPSWPEAGARYLQLSAAYDLAAAEARARG